MLSDSDIDTVGTPNAEISDKELEEMLFVTNMRISLEEKVRLLNDYCWDMCITKPQTKLDKSSETCLANCANRFLDVSKFIAERCTRSIQKIGNSM